MDGNAMAGATLAVSQTVALWTVIVPPVATVQGATPGDAVSSQLRHGETVVAAASVSVGVAMSLLEKSITPLVVSSIVLFTLIAAYEYTLRRPGYAAANPTTN